MVFSFKQKQVTKTNKMFLAILLFKLFTVVNSLYLTNNQYYLARGILLNPHITPFQKASIQNIFYISHEKWAIKKARVFKHRYYKCRNIST